MGISAPGVDVLTKMLAAKRSRRGTLGAMVGAAMLGRRLGAAAGPDSGAAPARGKTRTVCADGCEYETIAAALEDADDGDVIDIGEGTYVGGVVVRKNVSLRGAGLDKTTISGPGDKPVVRVGKRAKVTIEAVTITGGGGAVIGSNAIGGGGILNEGELVVFESVVRDNVVATSGGRTRLGGGIYTDSNKPVRIRDSAITGNQAFSGGGVFVRDGDVDIVRTVVSGNQSGSGGGGNGGGIRHEGGELMQIVDCAIIDNQAGGLGGGISASSPLRIVDTAISRNRAFGGGGVYSQTKKPLKVEGSDIEENTAALTGGGIAVDAGGLTLVDSTVANNQSRSGGGIATTGGDLSVKDSTISGNVASVNGGGILNRFEQKIDLDNSQVVDNRAGDLGGGVFGSSRLRLSDGSVVARNEPDQCAPVAC
jgi:hypothetical protein